MNAENHEFEQKSIRYALGKHEDGDKLASDCVGLANATGGLIQLGIEDDETEPPARQRVPDGLPEKLGKRIPQITINVGLFVRKCISANGGEFVEIRVVPSQQSIASTSDGRYFIRLADETHRLMPDELGRLAAEKSMFVWELQTTRRVPIEQHDADKMEALLEQIRASDRVSPFIRDKSDGEILSHYLFAKGPHLTNLGILWIGRREDRAALLYAPAIQCIKYDEREQKVRKQTWDDYSLNPLELIDAVWREVPDWRESYELPDGLFRKTVPHYDEVVVRELLANALVHRPYAQRGDIFINLHPDRLEVHNPGLLPIGVTPRNILHVTSKRNPHLAKVFYDLKLMEGEGSGFDRIYQVLLAAGKPVPVVAEGDDRVVVTVRKRIVNPRIVDFMTKADQTFALTQKELITLGLVAQNESMTAIDLCGILELDSASALDPWLGRLIEATVIQSRGRTKGTEYYVDPELLRKLQFQGPTTLRGIERHRLRELILKDLDIYRVAGSREIQSRIGAEIKIQKIRKELEQLVAEGIVRAEGKKRWTKYLIPKKG